MTYIRSQQYSRRHICVFRTAPSAASDGSDGSDGSADGNENI